MISDLFVINTGGVVVPEKKGYFVGGEGRSDSETTLCCIDRLDAVFSNTSFTCSSAGTLNSVSLYFIWLPRGGRVTVLATSPSVEDGRFCRFIE